MPILPTLVACRKNAKVTMAGVQIGKVKSIGYDQETYKAKVVLEISGEYDRLPLDSSADILTAGLLGEKYIGVVPGGDPAMLQMAIPFSTPVRLWYWKS